MHDNCKNCIYRKTLKTVDSDLTLELCTVEPYEEEQNGLVTWLDVKHFDSSNCSGYKEIIEYHKKCQHSEQEKIYEIWQCVKCGESFASGGMNTIKIEMLERSLRALSNAFDELVTECSDRNWQPRQPGHRAIMKARGYLPPYCKNSYNKKMKS